MRNFLLLAIACLLAYLARRHPRAFALLALGFGALLLSHIAGC